MSPIRVAYYPRAGFSTGAGASGTWKAEQSSERVVEAPVAEPKPRPVPRTGATVGGTTTEGEEELGAVNVDDSEEELEVIDVDSE